MARRRDRSARAAAAAPAMRRAGRGRGRPARRGAGHLAPGMWPRRPRRPARPGRRLDLDPGGPVGLGVRGLGQPLAGPSPSHWHVPSRTWEPIGAEWTVPQLSLVLPAAAGRRGSGMMRPFSTFWNDGCILVVAPALEGWQENGCIPLPRRPRRMLKLLLPTGQSKGSETKS
jgi:hypothetical protein